MTTAADTFVRFVEMLSQHLDDRWRELIAGGTSADDATQLTLAQFCGDDVLAKYLAPLRQAHAPSPITPGAPTEHVLAALVQSLRHAARILWKQPGFSAVAVLTLVALCAPTRSAGRFKASAFRTASL